MIGESTKNYPGYTPPQDNYSDFGLSGLQDAAAFRYQNVPVRQYETDTPRTGEAVLRIVMPVLFAQLFLTILYFILAELLHETFPVLNWIVLIVAVVFTGGFKSVSKITELARRKGYGFNIALIASCIAVLGCAGLFFAFVMQSGTYHIFFVAKFLPNEVADILIELNIDTYIFALFSKLGYGAYVAVPAAGGIAGGIVNRG